jgi:hypothetical protein
MEHHYPAKRGLLGLRFTWNTADTLEQFLEDEALWAWTEAVTLTNLARGKDLGTASPPEELRCVFERVGQVLIHSPWLVPPWQETLAAAGPERLTALLLMTTPEDHGGTDWLLRQPIFPAVRELWTHIVSQTVLGEESHFPELRRLHVSCTDNVRQLFRSQRFPRVELLRVLRADPRALSRATGFPALRHLILHEPPDSTGVLSGLARSPLLAHLTRLGLQQVTVDADGLADLLAAAGPLSSLQIRGARMNRQAAEVWAQARTRPDLRELILRLHKGKREVGDLVASSPLLESLEALDLSFCEIGLSGATLLGRSAGMPRWRHLDLARNPLGGDGLRALLAAGQPLALESLGLVGCQLEWGAIRHLESLARLAPNLIALDLADNQLDDEDFTWLASWDGLARIEYLNLSGNPADPGRVAALLRSPLLARCRYLRLPKGRVPSGMVDTARARFGPDCC